MKQASNTAWIYVLIDPRDEEIRYVGWTNDLRTRYGCHLRDKKPCYRTYWIMKLRRMGLKPRMEVVQEVSLQSWAEAEIYWISYFRNIGCKLVNGTDGGQGNLGWCPSEETRTKISQSNKAVYQAHPELRQRVSEVHKGKIISEEHRKISSIATTKRWEKWRANGRYLSPEARANISAAQRGKKHSQESRDKQSRSTKGKPKSPEHRAKLAARMTEMNLNRKGCKRSPESIQKQQATCRRNSVAKQAQCQLST